MNVVFINSHPIQYFAPLYQAMAKDEAISLKVIYLSDETVHGYKDVQFGVDVRWDIPLLERYDFVFLKNNSWKPSIKNGFFGLINLGLIKALRGIKPNSVIVVHGWAYFSNLLAIYVSSLLGHTVCLRGESPLKHERKSGFKALSKRIFFKLLLFPLVDKFLFIGDQNRLFYKKWGVKDQDLIFTPYCVDNNRFRNEFLQLKSQKSLLRLQYGVPADAFVFLYSGKYIKKKRPLDLLEALLKFKGQNVFLIMIGEGDLRPLMEKFIRLHGMDKQVLLTGFINQTEIPKYYAMGDAFVMCSGKGETWGLSVNEAMNFNLPLIVSDSTGCSDDLVRPENGYIFKTGDVLGLQSSLSAFMELSDQQRIEMGQASYKVVNEYSIPTIVNQIKATFAS